MEAYYLKNPQKKLVKYMVSNMDILKIILVFLINFDIIYFKISTIIIHQCSILKNNLRHG
jgi:hypothetical protein